MASSLSPDALERFYRRYNQACNDHRFSDLTEFVAEQVLVDGEPRSRLDYMRALEAVVAAFPDSRWDLRHLMTDGDWIAARFIDTGTHGGTFLGVPATGRAVTAQEFAFYRVEAGRIAEVWGTADDLHLLEQLR